MHVPATIPYNPGIRPDDVERMISREVFGKRPTHFNPQDLNAKLVEFAGGGEGTPNQIPLWLSGNRLTDSIMFEDGNGGIAVGGWDADVDPDGATLFVVDRINVVRTAAAGILDLGKVNGSYASPTKILSGESMGTLQFNAWSGSAFERGAFISAVATEDWDGSGWGTQLIFRTTPNNSTTQTQALTIDQDQTITAAAKVTAPAFWLTGGPSFASYSFAGSQHHIVAGNDGVTQNHVWMLAGTEVWRIDLNGDLRPGTNNTRNLGTTTQGIKDAFFAGEVLSQGTSSKSADQASFANAQTNVSSLSFAIGANETWVVRAFLPLTMVSTSGVKFYFTGPAGAAGHVSMTGTGAALTTVEQVYTAAITVPGTFLARVAGTTWVEVNARITSAGTAGTIQLVGITGAAATTCVVKAGAWMFAERLV